MARPITAHALGDMRMVRVKYMSDKGDLSKALHMAIRDAAHGRVAHGHQGDDNFSDSPALRLCCFFVHNAMP